MISRVHFLSLLFLAAVQFSSIELLMRVCICKFHNLWWCVCVTNSKRMCVCVFLLRFNTQAQFLYAVNIYTRHIGTHMCLSFCVCAKWVCRIKDQTEYGKFAVRIENFHFFSLARANFSFDGMHQKWMRKKIRKTDIIAIIRCTITNHVVHILFICIAVYEGTKMWAQYQ